MSKLKTDPVGVAELERYLDGYSDFRFELRVLESLTKLGLTCEHGGTYIDPIAKKSREFDIRARAKGVSDPVVKFYLSVECKNLRPHLPLVLHCIRPAQNEQYNDLIYSFPKQEAPRNIHQIMLDATVETERLVNHSIYRGTEFVAKSADQVGIKTDDSVQATDGGVFDKISQATNSAYDLISEAFYLDGGKHGIRTFVLPVLVVPDSTLWRVTYSDDGSRLGPPEPATHISYYIGKEWTVGTINSISYFISHLEIVELSYLPTFVKKYLFEYAEGVQARLRRGDTLS